MINDYEKGAAVISQSRNRNLLSIHSQNNSKHSEYRHNSAASLKMMKDRAPQVASEMKKQEGQSKHIRMHMSSVSRQLFNQNHADQQKGVKNSAVQPYADMETEQNQSLWKRSSVHIESKQTNI